MDFKVFLLFAILITVAYSFSDDQNCPACIKPGEYTDNQYISVFNTNDPANIILETRMYYENFSKNPVRIPITNAPLMMAVFDDNSKQIDVGFAGYTDENGQITIPVSKYLTNSSCIEVKVIYCPPACTNDSLSCWKAFGLSLNEEDAVNYYTLIKENPQTILQDPPKIKPNADFAIYCAPKDIKTNLALCLPLMIIVAFIAAGGYLTGKNPFTAWDFSAPRPGHHLKYNARGRGAYFDTSSAVSSAQRITGGVKGEIASVKSELGNAKPSFGKVVGAMALVSGKKLIQPLSGIYDPNAKGKVSMVGLLKTMVGVGESKKGIAGSSTGEQKLGVTRVEGSPIGVFGRMLNIESDVNEAKISAKSSVINAQKLTTGGKILDFTFMILERTSLGFLFSRGSFLYDWVVKGLLTKDVSKTESSIAKMRTELIKSQSKAKELDKNIEAKEKSIKDLNSKLNSASAKEKSSIKTSLENATSELKSMKLERDKTNKEIRSSLRDVVTEQGTLARLYADKAVEEATKSLPVRRLLDIDQKVEDLESKVTKLKSSETSQSEKGKVAVQQQVKAAESEIVSLKSERNEILSAPNAVVARAQYYAQKELEGGVKLSKEDIKDSEKRFASLDSRINDAYTKAESEKSKLEDQLITLKSQESNAKGKEKATVSTQLREVESKLERVNYTLQVYANPSRIDADIASVQEKLSAATEKEKIELKIKLNQLEAQKKEYEPIITALDEKAKIPNTLGIANFTDMKIKQLDNLTRQAEKIDSKKNPEKALIVANQIYKLEDEVQVYESRRDALEVIASSIGTFDVSNAAKKEAFDKAFPAFAALAGESKIDKSASYYNSKAEELLKAATTEANIETKNSLLLQAYAYKTLETQAACSKLEAVAGNHDSLVDKINNTTFGKSNNYGASTEKLLDYGREALSSYFAVLGNYKVQDAVRAGQILDNKTHLPEVLYSAVSPVNAPAEALALFESKSAEFNLRNSAESKSIPKLDQFVVSISAPIEVQREKIKSEIQSLLSQEIKPEKVAEVYDKISALSGELSRMDRSAAMSFNLASNLSVSKGFESMDQIERDKLISAIPTVSQKEQNPVRLEQFYKGLGNALIDPPKLSEQQQKMYNQAMVNITDNYSQDKVPLLDKPIQAMKYAVVNSNEDHLDKLAFTLYISVNPGEKESTAAYGRKFLETYYALVGGIVTQKVETLSKLPDDKLESVIDNFIEKAKENNKSVQQDLSYVFKEFKKDSSPENKVNLAKTAAFYIPDQQLKEVYGDKTNLYFQVLDYPANSKEYENNPDPEIRLKPAAFALVLTLDSLYKSQDEKAEKIRNNPELKSLYNGLKKVIDENKSFDDPKVNEYMFKIKNIMDKYQNEVKK